jgi:site-specific DNA-methyltransferase (adenine-specific)
MKKPINNKGTRYPSSVQKYSNGNNGNVHPTQKPVALFEFLIKTYTNEGDVVLDNCIGSGTTAVACINTGRSFIGIERETEYVEIANKRIQDAIERKGG